MDGDISHAPHMSCLSLSSIFVHLATTATTLLTRRGQLCVGSVQPFTAGRNASRLGPRPAETTATRVRPTEPEWRTADPR
jgi:hypothetical protein